MNGRRIQALAAAGAACALALVAWGGGPASAQGRARAASVQTGTRAASAGGQAQLTDPVCHHALNPVKRTVGATAVVRAMAGATTVEVDFRLRRRAPGGTFSPVHGPGLGTWLSKQLSRASDSWRVIHTVSDLSAPAAYRFLVGVRWIGSSGQILGHARRSGNICHQPELRPNLQVRTIQVLPDSANAQEDLYRAQIHDAGATGAGPFPVQLTDQGQVSSTRRVTHIQAHTSVWVRLVGPLCDSSAPPVVTVDPHDRVNVSSRARASLAATCPAPAGGTSAG